MAKSGHAKDRILEMLKQGVKSKENFKVIQEEGVHRNSINRYLKILCDEGVICTFTDGKGFSSKNIYFTLAEDEFTKLNKIVDRISEGDVIAEGEFRVIWKDRVVRYDDESETDGYSSSTYIEKTGERLLNAIKTGKLKKVDLTDLLTRLSYPPGEGPYSPVIRKGRINWGPRNGEYYKEREDDVTSYMRYIKDSLKDLKDMLKEKGDNYNLISTFNSDY